MGWGEAWGEGRTWAAAALGLVAWMVAPAIAQPEQEPVTFASIEIEPTIVKAVQFAFTPAELDRMLHDAGQDTPLRYRLIEQYRTKAFPEVTTFALHRENVTRTADAVRSFRDQLTDVEGVDPNHVFLVLEGGLGQLPHGGELAEAVSRRSGLQPRFITPEDKGAYLFDWSAPTPRRQQAVSIDVGAVTTIAGYQQADRPVTGVEIMPYGVGTMLEAVVEANGGVPPSDMAEALREFTRKRLAPIVYRSGLSHPAVLNRQRVYLSGGVVWVMAVILKPQEAMTDWVPLSVGDVRRFRQVLEKRDPFDVDVSGIADPDVRARAAAELEYARNLYTRDQLTAGALLLDMLATRLEFARRDRLFFARIAYGGWQAQHLLVRAREVLEAEGVTGFTSQTLGN